MTPEQIKPELKEVLKIAEVSEWDYCLFMTRLENAEKKWIAELVAKKIKNK